MSVSNDFDTQLQNKAEQIGGAVNTFRSMLGDQKRAFNLAVQKALNLNIEYPQYSFMLDSPEKFWLADAKKLGLDNDYLVIMDRRGNIIGRSRNVTKKLLLYFKRFKLTFNRNVFYKLNMNRHILRAVTVPYFYTFKQGYIIAVVSSYDVYERILWRHFLFVAISTLIFLVIASLAARIFVVCVFFFIIGYFILWCFFYGCGRVSFYFFFSWFCVVFIDFAF